MKKCPPKFQKKRILSLKGILSICVTSCLLLGPAIAAGQSSSSATVESNFPPAQVSFLNEQIENKTVYVGVWLINIFNYQYISGSYTFDMYVYFFWSDPNITTIDWNFANGYPITPTSVYLVSSNSTGEVKDEIYRATAQLSSSPDASNYPFDQIKLTLSIDLLTHGYSQNLVWLNDQTGVDIGFQNSGWRTISLDLSTSNHVYPLGVELPRAELTMTQERQRITTSFQPFLPPLIFAIVCAISFLFSLREAGAVGLRIGLNTSMLVTTLLFSFSLAGTIPPASSITIYTLFLLSVLFFMVLNLVVTIGGFVTWLKYNDEKRVKRFNRWGFLLAVVGPTLFFLLVFFTRI